MALNGNLPTSSMNGGHATHPRRYIWYIKYITKYKLKGTIGGCHHMTLLHFITDSIKLHRIGNRFANLQPNTYDT